MSTSWRCPFCNHYAAIEKHSFSIFNNRTDKTAEPVIVVNEIVACPNPTCEKFTLTTRLFSTAHPALDDPNYADHLKRGEEIDRWDLIPASRAKPLPDWVPKFVREDYEESCAIEALSPKASATLSRRCLQSIIRDFFGVSKPRLIDEIKDIQSRLDPAVAEAVDHLREIGNIGAHPERDPNVIVDVEPGEAAALIELIELLIEETYEARHQRQARLAKVKAVADAKAQQKAAPANPPTKS